MPRNITVTIKADTKDFERKISSAADSGGKSLRPLKSAIEEIRNEADKTGRKIESALTLGVSRGARDAERSILSLRSAVTSLAGVAGFAGASAAFKEFASRAVDAAISVDRQISSLRALTGTAEAATKRFRELFEIVQKTPGLTSQLATTLDTQLRVVNVNEQTINRLLPVIGRLNAVSPLGDPSQFVGNLTQLISQNFERQDLKELVGQSPLAGRLIQSIFNVDSPTNAEAIRKSAQKLGVSTVERLADELVKAAEGNRALRNAVETLGGQFDKLQDRLTVALAPIGDEILKVVLPALRDLASEAEQVAPRIANAFKEAQPEILALSNTLGDVARAIDNAASKLPGLSGGILSLRNAIRVALGGLTVGTAGLALPLQVLFERNLGKQDDLAAAEAARQARRNQNLPYGLTLDSLSDTVLNSPDPLKKTSARNNASASASTAAALKATAESQRVAKELAEIQKTIAQSQVEKGKRLIEQMQDLEKQVNEDRRELFNEPARQEARRAQLAGYSAANAERLRQIDLEDAKLVANTRNAELEKQRELMKSIVPVLSDSERLTKGFRDATLSLGDAWDRFGQNVAGALTNTKTLLEGLKQSLLGLFNDLVGSALQNVVGQALNPIAGLFGGGGFAMAGPGGGNFRTPNTFPQSVSSGALQNLAQAAGGGIGVPASVSESVGGLPVFRGNLVQPNAIASSTGGVISAAAGSGFSFSNLGKSLAGAAPFIGAGIGSSFGGQSPTGQIFGAAGGLLAGGAVAGFAGALGPTATALFTNPFTIAIGAGLLVGSYFLGKASQRKKDEEASGQYLTQALQSIDQLALGVQSGQIDGGQARQIFESQILGTFKQQISGLKTKSVVESRLTNQVRDLRKVFEDRIPPIIAEQQRKAADSARFSAIDSRLVPQFASGGIVPGIDRGRDSVMAMLRPGELVLNKTQQSRVISQSNPGVFSRAGVPAINTTGRYDSGGYAMPASGGSGGPMQINLAVRVGLGSGDAQEIVAEGMDGRTGEQIVINHLDNVNLRKGRR